MATWKDRLSRLEAQRAPRRGGVVVALPCETPGQAAERAQRGPVIVTPGMATDADAWEREAAAQQARLLIRAEAIAAGGDDPGLIEPAIYRRG